MSSRTIVLASRNKKKTQEVSEILARVGFTVISVTDFCGVPDVEEDGRTFAENAAKKASEVARHLNQWDIGEDSGVMVDALHGDPAIYAAHYRGTGATEETNHATLIADVAAVPDDNRGAGYICSVALSNPVGEIRIACEGACRGRILRSANGDGGFGYDPYFLIPEYHLTFGQLSSVVKHRLSHRARAFAKFIPLLQNVCSEF